MGVIIPIREQSASDVLYGARTTRYRWEVLTHDPATGSDQLAGFLDGVKPEGATLRWSANARVKGAGTVAVTDLDVAQPGYLRVSDLNLVTTRLRPVLVIDGLPEVPLGAYIISAAPESWTAVGRSYALELHDRACALDQDCTTTSYTADTSTSVLEVARRVAAAGGEALTVDATDTRTLAAAMVWPAGTPRLTIINDLLDAIGYNSLWVDGVGHLRATPYVRPAARPIGYDILADLSRELIDGPTSIYLPDWDRDRDAYMVPNRVLAVQAGSGDAEPLTGVAENTDPASPFSYQSRGRWVTSVLDSVETPDGTVAEQTAFLADKARQTLIASSAVQAAVSLTHLPLPLRVSDVVRFRSAPAGVDARHVVTSLSLDCRPTGLMKTELQEVVDL